MKTLKTKRKVKFKKIDSKENIYTAAKDLLNIMKYGHKDSVYIIIDEVNPLISLREYQKSVSNINYLLQHQREYKTKVIHALMIFKK